MIEIKIDKREEIILGRENPKKEIRYHTSSDRLAYTTVTWNDNRWIQYNEGGSPQESIRNWSRLIVKEVDY